MLLLLLDLELIGTQSSPQAAIGESGAEESEEDDEEWNYIKVEDKKSQQNELVALEENIEKTVSSEIAAFEQKQEGFEVEKAEQDFEEKEEPPTAPIEFATDEFEFKVSCMLIILIKTHQSI